MIEPFLGRFPRVDPTAYVHETALLIGAVTLGEEASVWPRAVLRGDDGPIRIGPRSNVQDGVVIHTTEGLSEVVVGAGVTIGHGAIIHGARIDDECLIGMGSTLLDNARVGRHALIGAGALVPVGVEIPPRSLVLGVPGRVVRSLTDEEVENIRFSWRHYVERARQFREG